MVEFDMAKRSMLDQYAEIKAQHPDTVLFFRMGDFYEMFHEDAVLASEVLGITLTRSLSRLGGNPLNQGKYSVQSRGHHQ